LSPPLGHDQAEHRSLRIRRGDAAPLLARALSAASDASIVGWGNAGAALMLSFGVANIIIDDKESLDAYYLRCLSLVRGGADPHRQQALERLRCR
jgi:hypothetical protein